MQNAWFLFFLGLHPRFSGTKTMYGKSEAGFWLTDPSEKYESVGMMTFFHRAKVMSSSHVPACTNE